MVLFKNVTEKNQPEITKSGPRTMVMAMVKRDLNSKNQKDLVNN